MHTPRETPLVRIRRVGTADTEALGRLRWEWRSAEGRPLEMGRVEFCTSFTEWASSHERTHLPFLAEVGEAAVGMAWLLMVERVPGPDRWTRLSGAVQSVYVSPDHRNSGVGAGLVQAVIDESGRLGIDYLGVHPSERSFSLYRRAGFEVYNGTLERDVMAERPTRDPSLKH